MDSSVSKCKNQHQRQNSPHHGSAPTKCSSSSAQAQINNLGKRPPCPTGPPGPVGIGSRFEILVPSPSTASEHGEMDEDSSSQSSLPTGSHAVRLVDVPMLEPPSGETSEDMDESERLESCLVAGRCVHFGAFKGVRGKEGARIDHKFNNSGDTGERQEIHGTSRSNVQIFGTPSGLEGQHLIPIA